MHRLVSPIVRLRRDCTECQNGSLATLTIEQIIDDFHGFELLRYSSITTPPINPRDQHTPGPPRLSATVAPESGRAAQLAGAGVGLP